MTTLAAGSSARISRSAVRPSFSGMVMSSVMMSGRSAWNCVDGLVAVRALADHLVPALGEHVAEHLAHEGGVVDDQHACHQFVPPWCRVRAGCGRAAPPRSAPPTRLSISSSRPLPKRRPFTNRSTGSSGAASRSTTAPGREARPRGRPASWLRPSSAHDAHRHRRGATSAGDAAARRRPPSRCRLGLAARRARASCGR